MLLIIVTLPPVPCDSICLTASWVMKNEPFQVGGDEATKLVDAVVCKRFGCEDARVVDENHGSSRTCRSALAQRSPVAA